MIGIYKITSPTGKVYIGQSWDVKKRWRAHRANHGRSKLLSSLRKHGNDAHVFEVIHQLPVDVEQATIDVYEQLYMDMYLAAGKELLNLREAGSHGKHSHETRKIIGEKSRGHKMPEHVKRILIKANKGHNRRSGECITVAHKKKISEALKGRVQSQEHKRKNSEAKKGEKCHWYGIEPSKHPQAKKLICEDTKRVFGTVTEGAKYLGIKRSTLSMMLTGKNHNKTPLRYDS